MLAVADAALFGPLGRPGTAVAGQVGAFGKQKQPHRVEVVPAVGSGVQHLELVQAVGQTGLVDRHLARHEDEAVEHHAGANDGDVLERLFQNDVQVTVHLRLVGVANPPQVEPVGVNLMIGNHDHAVGEVELDAAVWRRSDLAGERGIATDAYGCWAPYFGHGDDQEAERLLGQGHVGIV